MVQDRAAPARFATSSNIVLSSYLPSRPNGWGNPQHRLHRPGRRDLHGLLRGAKLHRRAQCLFFTGMVAEAAIASFLTPDEADRREGAPVRGALSNELRYRDYCLIRCPPSSDQSDRANFRIPQRPEKFVMLTAGGF